MDSLLDNIVVTEIVDVLTVYSEKGRRAEIPNRTSYGLSFCREGQLTYIHKGIEYVSDPEHAILLPQGQTYELRGENSGIFPLINFRCAEPICDRHVLIPLDDPDACLRDYEKMLQLRLFEGNRMQLFSLFYSILHRLSVSSEENLLAPAMKYIEKNYSNANLTNAELADQCRISEVYFRKLFLERYGVTPKQFVIDLRVNKAKQLLAAGCQKIVSISEQCGFSNPYHFSRMFKQQTGMTPTEYMMTHRVFQL